MATILDHDFPEDCWMAIHGKVYDMTEYAPLHPGAPTLITRHCGTDATRWYDFEHSVALLPIVDPYLLGTLVEEEPEEETDMEDVSETSTATTESEVEVPPTPTRSPTSAPTLSPTVRPTMVAPAPTKEPTKQPTEQPTKEPTKEPTDEPTEQPTEQPTEAPTAEPTVVVLEANLTPMPSTSGVQTPPTPTSMPTVSPTKQPTEEPTEEPTTQPTAEPTTQPTEQPTNRPTQRPSEPPTPSPTEGGCTLPRYTLADIANNADENSCWYGLYGVVYDFTDYIDDHKGGRGTILADCGTDATVNFELEKKHDVALLEKKGFASMIIGRQGLTSGVENVPCDEVGLVAVNIP